MFMWLKLNENKVDVNIMGDYERFYSILSGREYI